MRADVYLFEKGYAKSRQNAKTLIEEGLATLDGSILTKPSFAVDETAEHTVSVVRACPFVSRGGWKLEGALNAFSLSVEGLRALDVGASTGGFTDCLLQRGASSVVALDVGERQLDPKLAKNPRVTSVEHCNARFLTPADFGNVPFGVITMDVSFISATLILPTFADLLAEDGFAVLLIKPQFEVGKNALGKNGIVKDPAQHEAAIAKIFGAAEQNRLYPIGLSSSPIHGGDGNREFLVAFSVAKPKESFPRDGIRRVVLRGETVTVGKELRK